MASMRVVCRRPARSRTLRLTSSSLPRKTTSTLCNLCLSFEEQFMRPYDFVWKSSYPGFVIYSSHHQSWSALKKSAEAGCQLCKILKAGWLAEYHYQHFLFKKNASTTIDEIDEYIDQLERQHTHGGFVLEAHDQRDRFDERPCPLDSIWNSVIQFTGTGCYGYATAKLTLVLGVAPDSPAFHEGRFRGRVCSASPDLGLAHEWLEDCCHNHKECQVVMAKQLPTRLLWLSDDGKEVRLVDTNESQSYKYVTLSHRWGYRKPIVSKRSNLQDHYNWFSISALPHLFRDAAFTSHTLGYRYIWIDSLCIVQDDPNDWAAECVKMWSIFQGSDLTIAATDCHDSWTGFLSDREFLKKEKFQSCPLQYRNANGEPQGEVLLWSPGYPHDDKQSVNRPSLDGVLEQQPDSVLKDRGWIVQERILSYRTLYFGRYEMYLECKERKHHEMFHHRRFLVRPFHHAKRPESNLIKRMPRNMTPSEHHCWWFQIVQLYSRCHLTVPTDKLPAIAGIAHAFKPSQCDVYLAGLWQSNLPRALMWHRAYHQGLYLGQPEFKTQVHASLPYVAPSWSWASQDFPISYIGAEVHDYSKDTWSVQIKEARVDIAQTGPFGHVTGGLLRVHGKLREVPVVRSSNSTTQYSIKTEFSADPPFAEFYPDDLGQFAKLLTPLDSTQKSSALQGPHHPKVLALFLGYLDQDGHAVALVIEPVLGTRYHRRIGLLRFHEIMVRTDTRVFDDVDYQDVTII